LLCFFGNRLAHCQEKSARGRYNTLWELCKIRNAPLAAQVFVDQNSCHDFGLGK
jgi:hypothetical protein